MRGTAHGSRSWKCVCCGAMSGGSVNLLLAYAVTLVPLCALALAIDVYFVRAAQPDSMALEISTSFGLAFLAYGAIILVLGHVDLLRQATFLTLAALGAIVILLLRASIAPWLASAWRAARGIARSSPLITAGLVFVLGMAVALQVRSPILGDEKDYKWRTPLTFAMHHKFIEVPTRYSNGVYLMQLMSVPAATFREIPAARALQLIAAIVAVGAAWACARRLAGEPGWVAIALLTCPVLAFSLIHDDSDMWAAVLAFCAAAWVINRPLTIRCAGVVGLLLAAAAAVKIFMLATGVVIVLYAIFKFWRARSTLSAIIQYAAVVGAVVAGFLVVGGVHTWNVTGKLWEPNSTPLYHDGSPQLKSGRAAGRIPELKDIVTLPFVPYLTGVNGDEPYGTRTGLLMFFGLPLATLAAVMARGDWRRRLVVPLAVGAMSFLVLGPWLIKTRFLFFSWIVWSVALGVAVAWVRLARPREQLQLVIFGLTAAGAIELLNTASEMVKRW
jgi:hypothetical protein